MSLRQNFNRFRQTVFDRLVETLLQRPILHIHTLFLKLECALDLGILGVKIPYRRLQKLLYDLHVRKCLRRRHVARKGLTLKQIFFLLPNRFFLVPRRQQKDHQHQQEPGQAQG